MTSIAGLVPFVRQAGKVAADRQHTVSRSLKEDGSILTQVDKELDAFLRSSIVGLYPDANLISEETSDQADVSQAFTFAVDPIDGTDCYSQGMPGWSISVGLLDADLVPTAGFVFAPRWGSEGGSFLFADIGTVARLNDETVPPREGIRGEPQVMVGSDLYKHFRMDGFPGKLRNIGSTAVQIISPLLHSAVCGTIFEPNYIWDIAGAHAIVRSMGLRMEYFDGRTIDYAPLLGRKKADGVIVAGTEEGIELIRRTFLPIRA